MRLYVGNLSYRATEEDVQSWFAENGVPVDSVSLVRDRFSGQARGFGFAEVGNHDDAQRAISVCNGKELMGRAVVVKEALERREGPGGGGRGGSRGGSGGRGDRRGQPRW